MEFLSELLLPGNTSLAATLVLLSFVIAVGIYLGKIRFWGVSLGVTFVLFVGILMGHFGYEIQPEVLKFVREFGLILFIFAIGLQVGPGFFSSFKKGGIRLNMLAVLGILLNVAIVVAIYFIDGKTSISALVGVMSGAVTNTPGLAAAQQAASSPEDVIENTGFDIDVSRAVKLDAPDPEVIRMIREEIDPGQAFIQVPKD